MLNPSNIAEFAIIEAAPMRAFLDDGPKCRLCPPLVISIAGGLKAVAEWSARRFLEGPII